MAKGDGIVYNLIGFVLAIVSLFFLFFEEPYVNWQAGDMMLYFFTHFGDWWSFVLLIGNAFTSVAAIYYVLALLFPVTFLIAGACILIGIRSSGAAWAAAVLYLLLPLSYLIFMVIWPAASGTGDFVTLFLYMRAGWYLLLAGGIFCAIGASKNSED